MKSAARALDVFEAFARVRQPQSVKEIAGRIDAPMSSTSMLLQTLVARGYVYSIGRRGELYPTRRMLEIARVIAASDPVLERVRPVLERLRDRMGETVTFSTREGSRLVYLDILESPHPIRFSAQPGEFRPLHANTAGKAILAELAPETRSRILADAPMVALTGTTIVDPAALEADLEQGRARGWFLNDGESVPDVMAVGRAVRIRDELFGMALVGPIHRMRPRLEEFAAALVQAAREIEALDA
ncbi:IclR family transcriptional regulator [Burkholderiaceae bacterium FT117]|uniref:IclR family transcriptional regulator n=1 Tax=Zeimonas sediminis TaxID=2944268 RepID=UPI002342ECA5|nr:IclR family transcriptional regulator [Zeimonas sediminis]MCM5571415.1 IclR family transcriptional regulator [Zeimonas sediminis]